MTLDLPLFQGEGMSGEVNNKRETEQCTKT